MRYVLWRAWSMVALLASLALVPPSVLAAALGRMVRAGMRAIKASDARVSKALGMDDGGGPK